MTEAGKASVVETADGFAVTGRLDFDTVARLGDTVAERLDHRPGPLEFDLSGVRYSNSAGVALLLEWLRQARRQGVELHFVGIPAAMLSMIELAHLEDLLPVSTRGAVKRT